MKRIGLFIDVNIYDKQEKRLDALKEKHPMRFFFQNELHLFAEKSGFTILNFFEWLTWNQPGKTSWYVTAVCRKN